MRLWVSFFAAVVLFSCGGESSRHQSPGQEQPPVKRPVTAVSTAAPPDTRPIIVAFGDSLTDGFGVPPGQKYTDFLQKAIDDAGLKYRVINAGVSGDTTANALDRLPSVAALKPKLVILEIGGNDGLRGLPVEQTRRNLEDIVKGLQSAGAKVLLWGMTLPRNYGAKYVHDFEQVFTGTGKKYGLTILPVTEFGRVDMQPDGIHPTGAGYQKVAPVVFKYVRKELGE